MYTLALHQALEGRSRGRGARRLRQEECLASEELHEAISEADKGVFVSHEGWSPGSTHSALTRSSRHPSPTSIAPRRRRHEDCLALHCSARSVVNFRLLRERRKQGGGQTRPATHRPQGDIIDRQSFPRAPTASMNYQVARLPYFLPIGSSMIASKSCGSFTNRKSGRPHGNRMMMHLNAFESIRWVGVAQRSALDFDPRVTDPRWHCRLR
jgi:hypothetical protein